MIWLDKLRGRIFKERVGDVEIALGGLLPHTEDERDFKYRDLGGWLYAYQPKHQVYELKTLSTKDQGAFNTCVWNSYALSREPQEGKTLSVQSIVQFALLYGAIRGNGFSSLREAHEIGRRYGICDAEVFADKQDSWWSYSHYSMKKEQLDNAASHQERSSFTVRSRDEVLKALDDGNIVHTGSDWYSAYNMASGFSSPWILPWRRGWKVGGHAYDIIGYDVPRQVLKFKNSFGAEWGDNGCFYVRFKDWFKEKPVGYVSIDLDGDTLAAFVESHGGRDVKSIEDPVIYRITGGEKRPYPDEKTFFAWGGLLGDGDDTFEQISSSFLTKIHAGAPMRPEESPYWGYLANEWASINEQMTIEDAKKRIKEIIHNV